MASSLYQRLARQQSALDQLMADVAAGIRSPADYDRFEGRAQSVAQAIRDAFRTCAHRSLP